jgi:hypothetical protein
MSAAKAAPEDDALAQVAARYAVAITPAMEALIEAPHDRQAIPARRARVGDRAR